MKKVLIISLNQVEKQSGIEGYNSQLVNILNEMNYEVDEFTFIKSEEFNNSILKNRFFYCTNDQFLNKGWLFRNLTYRKQLIKEVNALTKNNQYDIIINSTNCSIKKLCWQKNYIWVQHFDSNFIHYSNLHASINDYIKGTIFRILLWCYGLKTPLNNSKNIVTFYNGFIQNKFIKNKINYFYIPIAKYEFDGNSLNINDIDYSTKLTSNLLYVGRIENKQKNLSFLTNIFSNIDYYGPIIDNELAKSLGHAYKGSINTTAELNEIIRKHSYVILASFYEGFPTIFVESLSNATPIISSNMIYANKYFFQQNVGFILEINSKNSNLINYNRIDLKNYEKLCKNAYNFAKNNLNKNDFIDSWIKVIKNIGN